METQKINKVRVRWSYKISGMNYLKGRSKART